MTSTRTRASRAAIRCARPSSAAGGGRSAARWYPPTQAVRLRALVHTRPPVASQSTGATAPCHTVRLAPAPAPAQVRVSAVGALSASVNDRGDGTYEVAYQCDEAGVHRLGVFVGETHLSGSPLAVTCEPGPLHVQMCELMHAGDPIDTLAGTSCTLAVRARDRFGNATSNVGAGNVAFVAELRAAREGDPPGILDDSAGGWQRGGIYELAFVPASAGHYALHVRCVRDGLGDGGAIERLVEDVESFPTIPMSVAALGADASHSRIVNAPRFQGAKQLAGSRIKLDIELRDRFGNPCVWPGDEYATTPGGLPLAASVTITPDRAAAGPPVRLAVAPRDEGSGGYEVRFKNAKCGRCSIAITFDGIHIAGSPVIFRVLQALPSGIHSRLAPASAPASTTADEASRGGDKAGDDMRRCLIGLPYKLLLQVRATLPVPYLGASARRVMHVHRPAARRQAAPAAASRAHSAACMRRLIRRAPASACSPRPRHGLRLACSPRPRHGLRLAGARRVRQQDHSRRLVGRGERCRAAHHPRQRARSRDGGQARVRGQRHRRRDLLDHDHGRRRGRGVPTHEEHPRLATSPSLLRGATARARAATHTRMGSASHAHPTCDMHTRMGSASPPSTPHALGRPVVSCLPACCTLL